MDLNKLVTDSLTQMEADGTIQKIVDKNIRKSIERIVEDLFGSYSPFFKDLKSELSDQLGINFKDLDISSYNHLLLAAVQDRLDDQVKNKAVEQIKTHLDSLLTGEKRAYKLSEIIKELAEEADDLDDLDYEEVREMTLHVENSYSSNWLFFDQRSDISKYNCKYRLLLSKDGTVFSAEIRDAETLIERSIKNFEIKGVMSGLSGVEELLFKIYTSGSTIIIDEDYCELELSNPDYE